MQKYSFKNKIILLAGASGGIGSSVVSRLSDSNSNVIAVYNKNHPDFQIDNNISLIKADLRKANDWDRVLHFAIQKNGKIDVMINCTGVLFPNDFINQSEEEINEMLSINLLSVILGTQKTMKTMQKQGYGHIINIGSIGGIIPMPYSTVYSATKFALRGFTHSLSQEIKDLKVFVSLVSPGPVNTRMLQLESDHNKTSIAFLNKALEPEQIADSIIKIINKPKTETIIPSTLSFTSRAVFLFPELFSKAYIVIEKIGIWRKRFYIKKQFNLSLQKRVVR
jgi:short-subunit dehydrogenase